MIPKVTDTFLFYSKFVGITLLILVNFSQVSAKAPCIVESNANNSCISEQSQGSKDTKRQQNSADFAIDLLYYSGGVLHNKNIVRQLIPNKESDQPTVVDGKLTLNDGITRNQNQDTIPENIISEIRGIFQNIDEVGRKSIQKCLRFGTYTTKIDGIWGKQTHNAINNFKNDANHLRQKGEANLFSKIKNIFSKKAVCHKLLDDTFG